MPLIECPECKNMISDTAKACPKCGYRHKRSKKPFIITGAVVLTITIIALAILMPRLLKSGYEKPGYEKALKQLIDTYFNGKCSVETVSELIPKDYWGERKDYYDLYSVKKVAERAGYGIEDIKEKFGKIRFSHRINSSKKISSAEVKNIEDHLSRYYTSIDIDIKEGYKLDFTVYCKKANLEHQYVAYAVLIDDNWYIYEGGKSFPDEPEEADIGNFAIFYADDYVELMIA